MWVLIGKLIKGELNFLRFFKIIVNFVFKIFLMPFEIKQTEDPTILHFVCSHSLSISDVYEFNNVDQAKISPLAQELFYLPFVQSVVLKDSFIEIKRFPIIQWEDVQEQVLSMIEEYIASGNPLIKTKESFDSVVPISVYAEITPNPSTMKFVTNKLLFNDIYEFKSKSDAHFSPLADELFDLPLVKEVFFSDNYISITKSDHVQWHVFMPQIREFLTDYLRKNKPLFKNEDITASKTNKDSKPFVSDTENNIIDLLENHIKPAVAQDGGNIRFLSFEKEKKQVNVLLQGACSGCPSSTLTLKHGIENLFREEMPGVVETVHAING